MKSYCLNQCKLFRVLEVRHQSENVHQAVFPPNLKEEIWILT